MSKLSIYQNSWINMVFEGKNKEYGAYQLRQESNKTTLLALFIGLLIVTSLISILMIINLLYTPEKIEIKIPEYTKTPIILSDIHPNQPKKSVKLIIPIEKKQIANVSKKEKLINPIVVKPIDANQDIEKNIDNTNTNNENTSKTTTIGDNTTKSNPTETGFVTATAGNENLVNTTAALDKLPEYPGGIGKFYTYIGNNFEKPELDDVKSVRVYVFFVIEKDGSMTDIQVKKDPGYGIGKEAIRVLKALKTKWSPGMISGKPVRTSYNLPITVMMQ